MKSEAVQFQHFKIFRSLLPNDFENLSNMGKSISIWIFRRESSVLKLNYYAYRTRDKAPSNTFCFLTTNVSVQPSTLISVNRLLLTWLHFRAWEGTWDGTQRTTSSPQNPDAFELFAGISEIWPVTEERLATFSFKKHQYRDRVELRDCYSDSLLLNRNWAVLELNQEDRRANKRQIKLYFRLNQNASSTNRNCH